MDVKRVLFICFSVVLPFVLQRPSQVMHDSKVRVRHNVMGRPSWFALRFPPVTYPSRLCHPSPSMYIQ